MRNTRTSLDIYDDRPEGMLAYLKYNGWHFNLKMYEFAISKMYKNDTRVVVFPKDRVDTILKNAGIVLTNNELWDYMYVAAMVIADFWGSSITDETHMAKYIKDVIDDSDGYDGIIFNRWYADMCKKGIPIDWDNMR